MSDFLAPWLITLSAAGVLTIAGFVLRHRRRREMHRGDSLPLPPFPERGIRQ